MSATQDLEEISPAASHDAIRKLLAALRQEATAKAGFELAASLREAALGIAALGSREQRIARICRYMPGFLHGAVRWLFRWFVRAPEFHLSSSALHRLACLEYDKVAAMPNPPTRP